MSGPRIAAAIDVGGTKVATGLVDETGAILARRQRRTADYGDAESLYTAIADDLRSVLDECGVTPTAIGVGCGGPMTAGGELVSPLNIRVWRDFPLRARLDADFGCRAFVDNDAKALTLGEWRLGAGRGHDAFLAMVVSTGIGGGIVVDGRLLDGAAGNAGHIGHVIVEPDGRVCGCGARGCVEAEASGTAIAAITGRPPVEAGITVRERTGRLVGRAVASAVSLLDLPLALVAGSVALGFGDVFFDAAQAELTERARLSFARGAAIQPAGLGADGPLIGAACVAFHRLEGERTGSPWPERPAAEGGKSGDIRLGRGQGGADQRVRLEGN